MIESGGSRYLHISVMYCSRFAVITAQVIDLNRNIDLFVVKSRWQDERLMRLMKCLHKMMDILGRREKYFLRYLATVTSPVTVYIR